MAGSPYYRCGVLRRTVRPVKSEKELGELERAARNRHLQLLNGPWVVCIKWAAGAST